MLSFITYRKVFAKNTFFFTETNANNVCYKINT